MPALNELAAKIFTGSTTYADIVHFVHIYVTEPHPQSPDVSPYTGQVWEGSYSTKSQPRTYDERVTNAADMVPLIEGNQLLLIDDLGQGNKSNPLWCTYGPAPNSAYLIRQDGNLEKVQKWVDVAAMEGAINSLVK